MKTKFIYLLELFCYIPGQGRLRSINQKAFAQQNNNNNNNNRVKMQSIEWQNIFAKYIFNKGLISKIYSVTSATQQQKIK